MPFTLKMILKISALIAVILQSRAVAFEPVDPATGVVTEIFTGQSMIELPVRVINKNGTPIDNAKIKPWALRSSQGHGPWQENDKGAGVGPKEVVTDAEGNAIVLYPLYRHVDERIRTTAVSLTVDHPEFALTNDLHIDVPHEMKERFHITLQPGTAVEVKPSFVDKTTDISNLYFLWSDGRSYQDGIAPIKLADDTFQIPAMPSGDNSVLVVKLDGERATHFSKIIDFKLTEGENPRINASLKPSVRVEGVLSANVPRPIQNGRVSVRTLNPSNNTSNRVEWCTSTSIKPDGTFTIEGWPADEPIQVTALCDGYHATSGQAPNSIQNKPDPATDFFTRPQVYTDLGSAPIEVQMTELARCDIVVKDDEDKPVAGVKVESWPNVCWWNSGSQIYCHPLVRGEKRLTTRSYGKSIDKAFPYPFESQSDARGKLTLHLPAGNETLAVHSEVYELPVFLGQRDVKSKLVRGKPTAVTLTVQPRGTEKLGEWDKLAGVVFGCSTREGHRICALPGVRKKMDHFAIRFRLAKNRKDPQLLSEAYAVVAEAFTEVGDIEEAAKWEKKAAEQAEKAKAKPRDE